ncbi:hypothetical protein [uncultured Gammaproteobacteria bacterium]|jgi:hypothetical protein|uniref:WxcM-like domain-containing protein n=1 Tax=Bathymodiolus azoricus thioautotrophic gill symbiont TaxID=235205 RepID=A0A1H6M9B5_9GAMM|nr:FdtA/QdtA family cupin domain-containing protein [Bathymodiolus azoricus thioautotrophic gill symbiont]CAC5858268.1 hypothetical protein [uncultured Gammaproteobacteria bacterium]CAC9501804.1 hypothetical protein [uncultured Gammaproteobacteria bacterium]CAC9505146.1 hypothetical protein [uncultured Gammaproteobacteria bacterium]CAC9509247.1 hypothetical protein [uncultured Gammaproteobacteria bacterium]CAC9544424.1 hypothetical protein [uncultured Gammaproteobacteria bacterium]
MAHILKLPTFNDESGVLTVVEKHLPFEVKRFYYIYNVNGKRGGHRHKKTTQALISLGGSCEVYVNNGESEEIFVLDSPEKCLILETKDWHTMDKFAKNTTLLVFASEYYDVNDYIDKPY